MLFNLRPFLAIVMPSRVSFHHYVHIQGMSRDTHSNRKRAVHLYSFVHALLITVLDDFDWPWASIQAGPSSLIKARQMNAHCRNGTTKYGIVRALLTYDREYVLHNVYRFVELRFCLFSISVTWYLNQLCNRWWVVNLSPWIFITDNKI